MRVPRHGRCRDDARRGRPRAARGGDWRRPARSEAAWGLAQRQMAVTVVHLMPTLMERQLDATAASLLQRDLVRRGIAISTNAQTEHILGAERVCGVRLADGRTIAADLVVMAVGTRPNIELAQAAGLDINRGIAVGDDL